jgi:casein kinase 1, alpha
MIEFTNSRYDLENLLGEGNFGWVYKAYDKTNQDYVAIKIEKASKNSQMAMELEVLQALIGEPGFPNLIDHGKETNLSFVVMSLLGQSLQKKLDHSRLSMTTENFLEIGMQCFQRIKTLHDRCYVHRDLKPQQFLIDQDFKIALVDFGLCKRFMNNKLMIHIPYSDNRPFVGTANYASLNSHTGIQQSRRDDLESFCYILSYMLNGYLPWVSKRQKFDEKTIRKLKIDVTGPKLFSISSLSQIFVYVKSLGFDQTPDYKYISDLLSYSIQEEKNNWRNSTTVDISNLSISTPSIKKSKKPLRKKRNSKPRKNGFCRSLDSLRLTVDSNSKTIVSDILPEFRDRAILKKKSFPDKPTSLVLKDQNSGCTII